MRKWFVVLAAILVMGVFGACSNLVITNEEGFRLFLYPHFITRSNVCVQSLDGFVVNDAFYTEYVGDKPATVRNLLDHEISVKITDSAGSQWVSIPAVGQLVIE